MLLKIERITIKKPLPRDPKSNIKPNRMTSTKSHYSRQLALFRASHGGRGGRDHREHGGGIHQGRRKQRRPLDSKRPVHLTMRSSRATGKWSLLHPTHVRIIEAFITKTGAKWKVTILERANVGNHLHLLVRVKSRKDFQGFLRELAGGIAMRITGARKSLELAGGRFWDELAYTRVVEWGRDLSRTARYIVTNLFEAAGLLSSRDKRKGLRAFELFATVPE